MLSVPKGGGGGGWWKRSLENEWGVTFSGAGLRDRVGGATEGASLQKGALTELLLSVPAPTGSSGGWRMEL